MSLFALYFSLLFSITKKTRQSTSPGTPCPSFWAPASTTRSAFRTTGSKTYHSSLAASVPLWSTFPLKSLLPAALQWAGSCLAAREGDLGKIFQGTAQISSSHVVPWLSSPHAPDFHWYLYNHLKTQFGGLGRVPAWPQYGRWASKGHSLEHIACTSLVKGDAAPSTLAKYAEFNCVWRNCLSDPFF